ENEIAPLIDVLIQIADALARAHEANSVHRDLKPENIMITPDGYAKILDFGLAKLSTGAESSQAPTAALSRAGLVIGTVGYIAPELIAGQPADARPDIFSFGCIVYEAIAQRRAVLAETASQPLQQVVAT